MDGNGCSGLAAALSVAGGPICMCPASAVAKATCVLELSGLLATGPA